MSENNVFDSSSVDGIPYELRRQTPREIELTGAGKSLVVAMVLLGFAAVALGVFLSIMRNKELARAADLDARGVTVQAQVVDTGITKEKSPRRFVLFHYAVEGKSYERRETFPRSDKRPIQIGDQIPIRYVPGDPGESWLAGYGPEGPPLFLVFMIPAIMAGSIWLMAYGLRRQRRLLAEGRAAVGTLMKSKRFLRGRQSGYRVEYEFKLLSGATQRSRVDLRKKPPEPGTTATILYDPDNPKRIGVYPLQLVRIARN